MIEARGMKAVVLYTSADDVLETAPRHFAAHSAHADTFAHRGELLMIGTFADPAKDGSMAVFTNRAAAEAFVADDPFVREGVVASWRILDWNEVLMPTSAA